MTPRVSSHRKHFEAISYPSGGHSEPPPPWLTGTERTTELCSPAELEYLSLIVTDAVLELPAQHIQ